MISGGVCPGGIWRKIVCATAVTWATPASTEPPGCKNTLITPAPLNELDSICSTSLTVALRERSWLYTMRCSTSWASNPVYCQIMLITGILMAGKMSVGVRNNTSGVSSNNASAATTNVYGLRKASPTIHITFQREDSREPPDYPDFAEDRPIHVCPAIDILRISIPWSCAI